MIKRRAGEMAQWVKVFAAKIYDLNSIHMVESTTFKSSSDPHTHAMTYMHPHIYTHKI